ncbi:MAG: hypothetical protein BJ554DRAFT_5092, partial [Olpidium bornovanus]
MVSTSYAKRCPCSASIEEVTAYSPMSSQKRWPRVRPWCKGPGCPAGDCSRCPRPDWHPQACGTAGATANGRCASPPVTMTGKHPPHRPPEISSHLLFANPSSPSPAKPRAKQKKAEFCSLFLYSNS